jgi:hypothetical protein
MGTTWKVLTSAAVAAALMGMASAASACSDGAGMTVWVPSSQSVADGSTVTKPTTNPDKGG